MRKVIWFVLVFSVVLVACRRGDDNVPVQEVTGVEGEITPAAVEVAPRVEATPTPTLPATWTPAPMTHGGHLYLLPVAGGEGARVIYVVQPGDTLAKIAHRYHVSVWDLALINHIEDIDRIEKGSVLVIPVMP
ncbi:MAG: LysM domain-containing protein [Chloroflexi bacterium]|nr:MAG: LysM domain-containing protein [Chloroflexota bacterium]